MPSIQHRSQRTPNWCRLSHSQRVSSPRKWERCKLNGESARALKGGRARADDGVAALKLHRARRARFFGRRLVFRSCFNRNWVNNPSDCCPIISPMRWHMVLSYAYTKSDQRGLRGTSGTYLRSSRSGFSLSVRCHGLHFASSQNNNMLPPINPRAFLEARSLPSLAFLRMAPGGLRCAFHCDPRLVHNHPLAGNQTQRNHC